MLKTNRIRVNRRRLFLPLLGLLVPVMGVIAPALPASAAANLQLQWLDSTHIKFFKGGSLQQDAMVTFASSDGGKTLGYPGYVGLLTTVKVTYQGKSTTISCYVPELVTFQNNTIGRGITLAADMTPPGPSSGTGTGPQRCPSPTTPDSVGYHSDSTNFHQFDGNYTTTNDWPGGGGGTTPETASQKIVSVSITSWLANSPKTLPVTLTPNGKKALPTVTSSTQVVKTGDASVNHVKYYTYTATISGVPPGDFSICANFGKNYCDTGTKKIYVPGSAFIEMGSPPEGTDSKIVQITTEYDNPQLTDPGVAQTFGPFNIDLKQGDKVIQTQTTTFKYAPSSECKNASTAACGTSLIQDTAYFSGIAPGQYQACLQGTTRCTSVFTKSSGEIAGFSPQILLKLNAADITAASSDNGGNDATLDCGGGSFNWFICPFITLAQGAAEKLDGYIASALTADISQTFDQSYYKAWNTFRILATALLIIAGLVMVASQALGFEFLDAYTVRKVLPRLLVAVIGMSLSWPLLQFIVGFFNTFGQDVYGIITAPFGTIHAQINPGIGALSTLLVPVAGVAALFVFGPAALLMILSGFIGLFMAFFILIIRQIAITVIVIVAPIAIACYILPNTQKVWNVWRENFLGLMMMFPIVMAFIAAGHAFAMVSIQHGGGLSQIIGIIAYFIPYFLLPLAFRLATGVIGTLSGMVNDRSKGVFDRMKGFRAKSAAQRHQMRMAGQTKFGTGRTGSLYRRAGLLGTPNSGALGIGAQGRANFRAAEQRIRDQAANEALKNDNGRAAGDDIANEVAQIRGINARSFISEYSSRALAKGQANTQAEADAQARSALGLVQSSYGATVGSEAMRVAAYKAQQASVTGYGDTDDEVARRFNDAHTMVQDGLITSSDAMAAIKQNKARVEASGVSFGTGMGMIAKGGITTADVNTMMDTTLDGLTPGSLVGARREAGAVIARHLKRKLDNTYTQLRTATGPQKAALEVSVKQQLGHIAGVQDTINSQAPQMAREFADGLMSQAPAGTIGTTVRQEIEALRSMQDNDFEDVRKEWLGAVPPGTPPGTPPPPPPAPGAAGGAGGP